MRPERFPVGPVRDLALAPPPALRTPFSRLELLAVDLETTGLDPATDHLLTVGWVPLRDGEVRLAEARELAVRPPHGAEVGASATLHRVTDDALAEAEPLDGVLPELLAALRGRVLLAHHTRLEVGFLSAATWAMYGASPPLVAVDTMALQHRLVVGQHGEVDGSLRLDAARRRFGLPRYRAHRALTDAVAAGELLLAQVAELGARLGREPTLRDLAPVRTRGRPGRSGRFSGRGGVGP